MKNKPSGTSLDEAEDLSSIVEHILESTEKSTLDRVSLKSMKKIQLCIDVSGDHPE
jgi:hypothetical protein